MFFEYLPAHVDSVSGHVFGLAGVSCGCDVSSSESVRADRAGAFVRLVERKGVTGLGVLAEGALPAIVGTGPGSGVDVLLDRRAGDSAVSRGEKWRSPVVVFHVRSGVGDVVVYYVGCFPVQEYVAFTLCFLFQGGASFGSVSDFQRGAGGVEVFEVHRPESADSHTRFPENQQREVPIAGIFILIEKLQYSGSLLPREEIVTYLVVLADRGNPNHIGHPAWNSRDMFTELHELFNRHHVLPRRDDLDVRQSVFLVSLYEFAVEVIQCRKLLTFQPVTELPETGAVVFDCLPGYARLLVVEESVLGFMRRCWFQCHASLGTVHVNSASVGDYAPRA